MFGRVQFLCSTPPHPPIPPPKNTQKNTTPKKTTHPHFLLILVSQEEFAALRTEPECRVNVQRPSSSVPEMLECALHFSCSCQHCQHWSVSKDFSWQNSEATFWHLQQTNCCLLPLRALWSPNELVSSRETRKRTHKINLSGYYALSSAKTKPR